jgi:hypothetical protein
MKVIGFLELEKISKNLKNKYFGYEILCFHGSDIVFISGHSAKRPG